MQAHPSVSSQERSAQLEESLGSLLTLKTEKEHWLHDHPAEAHHLLSLFGVFGPEERLLSLLANLLEQLKNCSTCVIAYHAAQVGTHTQT